MLRFLSSHRFIPFFRFKTSLDCFFIALGGLCAAASAAAIELLPLVNTIELQALLAAVFPSGAALFAAAASVSKARCEVR